MNLSKSQRLLAQSDVRRFLSGQLAAEIGSRITREGLPIVAIVATSATAPQLGVLAALATLPSLLAGNLIGRWVDRSRKRPLLAMGSLFRTAALLIVPLLYVLHELTFLAIATVTVLVATAGVLIAIAQHAYLPFLVTRPRIEEGNQLMGTADSIGETTGPAVMGLLIQWVGAPLSILFDALANIVAAISLSTISAQEKQPAPHPNRVAATPLHPDNTRQVWLRVARHPILRPLWLNAGVSAFFGGFFSALYELYVLRTLHLTPLWLGILITLGGLGSLVGTRIFGRLRRTLSLPTVVLVGYLAYALLNFTVPLAHGTLWLAFGFLVVAQFGGDLFATISQIAAYTVEQHVTPDHWLGRVRGTFHALAGGLQVFGALVAGPLALLTSVRIAFWIATAGILAAAPLLANREFRGYTAAHNQTPTDIEWP